MNTHTSYGLVWKRELGSRSFAISPDGNRVAVVSYEDGELAAYS